MASRTHSEFPFALDPPACFVQCTRTSYEIAMPRELSRAEVDAFRAQVCAAAGALYAKKGEDAITMRELARALNCSPMGLYRYFKDRDEIIAALRTDAFNTFSDSLEAAFARGDEPFARAREVGRAYLAFALENPNLY